ncbi:esterase/lipase family protein [Streptomyces sp. NPDC057116]|uniref:esterase/lipase family protein n=1 Tax=Streptomyces sp. NPDC057116 TaxID=3346023 RepID=UPI003624DE43
MKATSQHIPVRVRNRTTSRRLLAAGLAALVLTTAAPAVLTGQASADTAEPATTHPTVTKRVGHTAWHRAFLASIRQPDAAPPGANDWNCKPTEKHPRPVVLIHGTYENAYNNWSELSPKLKEEGYCVFAGNFGAPMGEVIKGKAAIPESAKEVARFVDRVLTRTGAEQVDLVGHSQGGGILPRYYLKFEGGADAQDPSKNKVNHLVGISPSNHGTMMTGLATIAKAMRILDPVAKFGGQALKDQTIGSDVNRRLDAGGDTMPGVTYTTLVTMYDEVVNPYHRQYIHDSGPTNRVKNITLQDHCPVDLTDHIGSSYDPFANGLVLKALDPTYKPKHRDRCRPIAPVIS